MTEPSRERLLTRSLAAFLLAIAAIVGSSVYAGRSAPDLEGCIEMLADGDLDGPERDRMLLRTIDLARAAESTRQRWAGLLAAVALGDREAFAAFDDVLGPGEKRTLPSGRTRWLSLGDPMLANLLRAMMLESGGDLPSARLAWQQVAAQARMIGNAVAADLAQLAHQRLR